MELLHKCFYSVWSHSLQNCFIIDFVMPYFFPLYYQQTKKIVFRVRWTTVYGNCDHVQTCGSINQDNFLACHCHVSLTFLPCAVSHIIDELNLYKTVLQCLFKKSTHAQRKRNEKGFIGNKKSVRRHFPT